MVIKKLDIKTPPSHRRPEKPEKPVEWYSDAILSLLALIGILMGISWLVAFLKIIYGGMHLASITGTVLTLLLWFGIASFFFVIYSIVRRKCKSKNGMIALVAAAVFTSLIILIFVLTISEVELRQSGRALGGAVIVICIISLITPEERKGIIFCITMLCLTLLILFIIDIIAPKKELGSGIVLNHIPIEAEQQLQKTFGRDPDEIRRKLKQENKAVITNFVEKFVDIENQNLKQIEILDEQKAFERSKLLKRPDRKKTNKVQENNPKPQPQQD